MIYIDPPFDVGVDFSIETEIERGEAKDHRSEIHNFLAQLVTLPELWSQPSFPEFVDWLIRFSNIVI